MPILRPATPDEKEFCRELHWRTMRAYVEAIWGWNEAEQSQRFESAFDPSRTQIIEHDGQAIGMLVVDRAADPVKLMSIEIAPGYQNRGYGSAVIGRIVREAKNQAVWLQVLKVNRAKGLYERLGFVVVGETPTHWQMLRDPGKTGAAT